jgi:hypothetical protein
MAPVSSSKIPALAVTGCVTVPFMAPVSSSKIPALAVTGCVTVPFMAPVSSSKIPALAVTGCVTVPFLAPVLPVLKGKPPMQVLIQGVCVCVFALCGSSSSSCIFCLCLVYCCSYDT